MGTDQRIVRAARVSFGKDDVVDVQKDVKLIKYLLKNKHASPFEHVIIAIKTSKQDWIQLIENIDNSAVPVYYTGDVLWLSLRSYINAKNCFTEELNSKILERLQVSIPATLSIINGNEIHSYTKDSSYATKRIDTSSGYVALVDSLELDTDMDYYTFIVECPIFVARQWHRHRFGSYNEISRRYTDYEPEFYIPNAIRRQSSNNKQASEDSPIATQHNTLYLQRIKEHIEISKKLYADIIIVGGAKELARGILPQFMKTRFYWTVPRIALDNFIALRTHSHAQAEIREFGEAINSIVGYKATDTKLVL